MNNKLEEVRKFIGELKEKLEKEIEYKRQKEEE